MTLVLAWLSCTAVSPPMPWQGLRADLAEERAALHAAERQRVTEQLAKAEDSNDALALRQVMPLAVELGLRPAPPVEVGPSPLDERIAGANVAHAEAVLNGVRLEYRLPVEEAAWGEAAAQALGVAASHRPEESIRASIVAGRPEGEAVVLGVEAALASLDPYTRAIWPQQLAQWAQHHAGIEVGVGMRLHEASAGVIAVEELDPEGPAWAANLHVGDVVEQVDQAAVTTLDGARAALAGPEGAPVALVLRRRGEPITRTLVRASVPETTVFGYRRRADQGFDVDVIPEVAWIHIRAFRPQTDEDLLALVGDKTWSAVVLDLRGNPGGDVQAALNVVDAWLDAGQLVQMSGRAAPRPGAPDAGEAAWNEAVPGGPFVGAKTVVLVDQETASAAEIAAGALQQLANATVIGAPTTGKGLSQALRSDDALGVAWQVTNFAWSLPDGRVLAPGSGILPDVSLVPTPAERWQTERLRDQREAVIAHEDGSDAPWVGPAVHESLPALSDDPMRIEALYVLQR